METLRGNPDSLPKLAPRIPSAASARFRPFRFGSSIVRLAATLPDLEACLALERRSATLSGGGRLAEPTAVPDCDFLMAADLGRRVLGVCRLLPRRPEEVRHSLPGAPRHGAGDSRFGVPAALLTALRYSCRGVLEVGGMAIASDPAGPAPADDNPGKVAEALWEGVAEYMAALGYGYALGCERVTPPEGLALEEVLGALQEDHGLHPDLEAGIVSHPRPDWLSPEAGGSASSRGPGAAAAGQGDVRDWLPKGFQEGLRRGIHLIGRPRCLPDAGLEFAWVASSELLRRGPGT